MSLGEKVEPKKKWFLSNIEYNSCLGEYGNMDFLASEQYIDLFDKMAALSMIETKSLMKPLEYELQVMVEIERHANREREKKMEQFESSDVDSDEILYLNDPPSNPKIKIGPTGSTNNNNQSTNNKEREVVVDLKRKNSTDLLTTSPPSNQKKEDKPNNNNEEKDNRITTDKEKDKLKDRDRIKSDRDKTREKENEVKPSKQMNIDELDDIQISRKKKREDIAPTTSKESKPSVDKNASKIVHQEPIEEPPKKRAKISDGTSISRDENAGVTLVKKAKEYKHKGDRQTGEKRERYYFYSASLFCEAALVTKGNIELIDQTIIFTQHFPKGSLGSAIAALLNFMKYLYYLPLLPKISQSQTLQSNEGEQQKLYKIASVLPVCIKEGFKHWNAFLSSLSKDDANFLQSKQLLDTNCYCDLITWIRDRLDLE